MLPPSNSLPSVWDCQQLPVLITTDRFIRLTHIPINLPLPWHFPHLLPFSLRLPAHMLWLQGICICAVTTAPKHTPLIQSVYTWKGVRGAVLVDLYQTLLICTKWDGLPMGAIHGYLLEINGQCYILILPESAAILATVRGRHSALGNTCLLPTHCRVTPLS